MDIVQSFTQAYNQSPVIIASAPGRVNLLGEHIDYNSGPVLPAAIDKSVVLACAPAEDNQVEIVALDLQQKTSFRLDQLDQKITSTGDLLPQWALYPAGVAWALRQAGLQLKGLRAVFTSTVPIGAGLSSSAAVEVGFAQLWLTLSDLEIDALQVARICQRAENAYVGVSCGLMDQFACACGVADHALYFDTRSLDWHPVPLPDNTVIVIADSGVRRSLTSSAYNNRRSACEQAVALLQTYLPHIQSLRDVKPTEFAALSVYLPDEIRMRAEHVVKEIARVEAAVTALNQNDPQAFGALMYSGHASLRDLYHVSTPELDALVEIARQAPGCWGARLTGAGFGGCTVNLVDIDQSQPFIDYLQSGYTRSTRREASVYLCRASAGAQAKKIP